MTQHEDTRDQTKPDSGKPQGPTYLLDLEGSEHEWSQPTITVPQIRQLAGWGPEQQVMMVDLRTQEETTLTDDAVVELKPGHGFGRKFKFRRGTA